MARVTYGPVCRDRIRVIKSGFGWVDHRLVRNRYVDRCSVHALALYLFLVTVSDADGVSFWGDGAICERLPLTHGELLVCRQELIDADLLAYEKPVSQVLQLTGGEK
ncbi:MAG: hypothetical protein DRI32_07615 [Chloroflexi bacterium]|nr:MAG: hypothetical protein DRI32_07615 [Chloroflexota bacterium]